jgi:MFS-type transporter involved in bile tolerance (Atg22 family)
VMEQSQLLPPPPPVSQSQTTRTGLSTAALVMGVVGSCIGLIPILGILALPLGILAIIFGIVGIRRRAKEGFAIAGLVTGLLALVLSIAGIAVVDNAVHHLNRCTKAIQADANNNFQTDTATAACK